MSDIRMEICDEWWCAPIQYQTVPITVMIDLRV